jgi:hypothetical protein
MKKHNVEIETSNTRVFAFEAIFSKICCGLLVIKTVLNSFFASFLMHDLVE